MSFIFTWMSITLLSFCRRVISKVSAVLNAKTATADGQLEWPRPEYVVFVTRT